MSSWQWKPAKAGPCTVHSPPSSHGACQPKPHPPQASNEPCSNPGRPGALPARRRRRHHAPACPLDPTPPLPTLVQPYSFAPRFSLYHYAVPSPLPSTPPCSSCPLPSSPLVARPLSGCPYPTIPLVPAAHPRCAATCAAPPGAQALCSPAAPAPLFPLTGPAAAPGPCPVFRCRPRSVDFAQRTPVL